MHITNAQLTKKVLKLRSAKHLCEDIRKLLLCGNKKCTNSSLTSSSQVKWQSTSICLFTHEALDFKWYVMLPDYHNKLHWMCMLDC